MYKNDEHKDMEKTDDASLVGPYSFAPSPSQSPCPPPTAGSSCESPDPGEQDKAAAGPGLKDTRPLTWGAG